MYGGAGNDAYFVDNGSDTVNENANEGIDTVYSTVHYTLSANVETLVLQGSADLQGYGNSQANTLYGNIGNNLLDGDAGADTMIGGAGDDLYIVDNAFDVVTESAGQGTDAVQASNSYALSANVENLALTGTANINATGNSLANLITGNGGNNTLDGGAEADTLIGGAYVVDNALDVVTEAVSEGTDLVQASVIYTLSANVENLTLTGSADINGTGNTLANTITGNGGNNTLDRGAEADTLIGGAGNDTYVVDNALDVVTEAVSEGTDLRRCRCRPRRASYRRRRRRSACHCRHCHHIERIVDHVGVVAPVLLAPRAVGGNRCPCGGWLRARNADSNGRSHKRYYGTSNDTRMAARFVAPSLRDDSQRIGPAPLFPQRRASNPRTLFKIIRQAPEPARDSALSTKGRRAFAQIQKRPWRNHLSDVFTTEPQDRPAAGISIVSPSKAGSTCGGSFARSSS
jgi:hypothetical protein